MDETDLGAPPVAPVRVSVPWKQCCGGRAWTLPEYFFWWGFRFGPRASCPRCEHFLPCPRCFEVRRFSLANPAAPDTPSCLCSRCLNVLFAQYAHADLPNRLRLKTGASAEFGYEYGEQWHRAIKAKHVISAKSYCLLCTPHQPALSYAGAMVYSIGALRLCPRCNCCMDVSVPNCFLFAEPSPVVLEAVFAPLMGGPCRDLVAMINRCAIGAQLPWCIPPCPIDKATGKPHCPKQGELPPPKMLVCGWCVRRFDCGVIGWCGAMSRVCRNSLPYCGGCDGVLCAWCR